MFDVFGSVKGLLKLDSVCIDNNVFRLHYKATVIILITFSLLVTSRQYIGDPIDCIVDEIPLAVMDTYCWIYSTFTIPNRLVGRVGKDMVQPGVSSHVDGQDEVKYHKYYQWVCFVLFFQAILFYVPRYLWKTWEGGRIKMLVLDLNCPVVGEDCKSDRKKLLVDYFHTNLHTQNFYAFRFFICEVLNFINVVGQIFFMDFFLDGEFSTYGADVVRFTEMEPEEREDPMARVFPKVTKCTFHKYGPSGTVQKFDGLCVLPLNIVNEKIYVFLWFWFVILSILSGISLLYRMAVVAGPRVRLYLLRARSRLAPQEQVESVARKLQIGDWRWTVESGLWVVRVTCEGEARQVAAPAPRPAAGAHKERSGRLHADIPIPQPHAGNDLRRHCILERLTFIATETMIVVINSSKRNMPTELRCACANAFRY
ncbi:unnamed protein product [Diatraea saccharalis]|uniref:Innexin n=1 Tax=Diatraea saccharalis TaxID=40085 RepID=A0A9N9QU22_9NEOP|nr:unnamed protein product [Diatraea saccharalis]